MVLPTQKTPPKQTLSDLTVFLYGPTKFGKSSMCAHADGALFLATEPGLNHLDVFQVPIASWDDFLGACREIAEGKHPFKTIIVDTVDNAYRMCVEHVLTKHKIDHESDLGFGKGYALVNGEFYRVLNKLAMLPYGLFLISHSQEKEVETRTGKSTRIVPTLPEKARKAVLGLVDVILFGDFETLPGPEGKSFTRRVLRTKPSQHFEAGDRTGRLPEVIELDYAKFVAAFAAGVAAPKSAAAGSPPPTATTNSSSTTTANAATPSTTATAGSATPRAAVTATSASRTATAPSK